MPGRVRAVKFFISVVRETCSFPYYTFKELGNKKDPKKIDPLRPTSQMYRSDEPTES